MQNSVERPAGSGEWCVVVVNDEGQYSVWWQDREVPAGWRARGAAGTREECLARIEELWTDMRPLSRRPHAGSSAAVGNPAAGNTDR